MGKVDGIKKEGRTRQVFKWPPILNTGLCCWDLLGWQGAGLLFPSLGTCYPINVGFLLVFHGL